MKRSLKSALVLGAAIAVTAGGGSVAVAGQMAAQACSLRSDVPNSANDAIVGREGCSTKIDVEGRIKEDRNNWPDDTVGFAAFKGGTAWVYGSCGNGYGKYYSQVDSSSGASQQSSRVNRCG